MLPAPVAELWSFDRTVQHAAFTAYIQIADHPVDWAYTIWDDLDTHLTSPDNHDRAIAAQLLCCLAKSDPEKRIFAVFDRLITVVYDERFVTARHTLQALWQIAVVSESLQDKVLSALEDRFMNCVTHKNCTLIRYDIAVVLRKIYDISQTPNLVPFAEQLAVVEIDEQYRKKYLSVFRSAKAK